MLYAGNLSSFDNVEHVSYWLSAIGHENASMIPVFLFTCSGGLGTAKVEVDDMIPRLTHLRQFVVERIGPAFASQDWTASELRIVRSIVSEAPWLKRLLHAQID